MAFKKQKVLSCTLYYTIRVIVSYVQKNTDNEYARGQKFLRQ